MTEPAPLPTEPLLTQAQLAIWAQERPLADPEFADLVIDAVTTLLRETGRREWDIATLPKRARDIGYFVARNYYLNPDLVRQESLGPLQETRDNKVLQGIEFTEDQEREIKAIAAEETGGEATLWTLGFTRGPLEMGQRSPTTNALVYDTRGAWPIEYLTEEEAVVFEPVV